MSLFFFVCSIGFDFGFVLIFVEALDKWIHMFGMPHCVVININSAVTQNRSRCVRVT